MVKFLRFIILIAFTAAICTNKAKAQATVFFNQSFQNTTAANISLGGNPNSAILTGDNIIDANGSGFLRLTNATQNQTGYAYYTQNFPSTNGVDVEFEYYTYGGDQYGADGITFFLFDASVLLRDLSSSQALGYATAGFSPGAFGGSLGYAQRTQDGKPGTTGGYIGIGLDEFGNFAIPNPEGRNGGINEAYDYFKHSSTIALRGQGDGLTGYPYLTSIRTYIPSNDPVFISTGGAPGLAAIGYPNTRFEVAGGGASANGTNIDGNGRTGGTGPGGVITINDAGYRKVRMKLTPHSGGPGYDVAVRLTVGGATPKVYNISNYYYSTVAPTNLSFGFAASTGNSTNVHEIRNVAIKEAENEAPVATVPSDLSFKVTRNTAKKLTGISFSDVDAASSNVMATLSLLTPSSGALTAISANGVTIGGSATALTLTGTITAINTFLANISDGVTYTPQANSGTDVTVTVNINDKGNTGLDPFGRIGAAAFLEDTEAYVIDIISPPIVTNINKGVVQDGILTFTASNFNTSPFYTDADGDVLTKIRITTLPTNGVIKIGGVTVISGDLPKEILLADLGTITYVPDPGYSGSDVFKWNGYDGGFYALTDADVNIGVLGSISGAGIVCAGSTIALTHPVSGGIWSSGTPVIATVNSSTGVVTGVSAGGPVTITYTFNGAAVTKNITVNALPSAPSSGGNVTVCIDGSTYTGSATVGGAETLVWYTAATGGIVTTAPSRSTAGTTTAYAAAVNNTTSCESATRTQVTVTINALPSAPTSGGITVCFDNAVHAGSATVGGGETIVWYTAATGGTITTAPSGTTAGIYTAYAASKNTTTDCESATRTAVTVTINDLPAAPASGGNITVCFDNIAHTGSATPGAGETIVWYTAATGGTVTTAPSRTAVGTTTAYAASKNTTTDCESATRTAVTVTINDLPAAPSSGGNVTACFDNVAHTGSATAGAGETIIWYTAATGGTVTVAPSRTAVGTTTAYAASKNTTTDCESATRTVVTVTVNAMPVVAAITGASSVAVGATTTYSSTTAGGTWASNTPSVATVNSSGVVTGVSAGTASITYSVTTNGCTTTVSKTITVTAVSAPGNNPPVAISETYSVVKGGTLTKTGGGSGTGILSNGDNDPDGSPITVVKLTNPANGTLTSFGSDGSFVYVHNNGTSTSDSFTYTVNDGTENGNTATVNITITTANQPPVVADITKTGSYLPIPFTLADFTGKYSDPEGTPLAKVKVVSLPANGTLKLSGVNVTAGQEIPDAELPNLTFTPAVNWSGSTTFPWNGSDGSLYAVTNGNVNITVTLPTDPTAKIGVAKKLASVTDGLNGSYNITFTFTTVNYGLYALENISLQDNLALAFAGTNTTVTKVTAFGNLKANPAYDGKTVTEMLLPASRLTSGEEAQVQLEINVQLLLNDGLFNNTATAEGYSSITGFKVTDKSTNGLKPDPGTAGDVSPFDATPVELTLKTTFVPEGFSPNGDGVNDYFFIQNALNKNVSLEVFNRWGNRVYQSNEYRNDWNGRCTEGFFVGRDIPDGTYFYVIVVDKKDKYVGAITINR